MAHNISRKGCFKCGNRACQRPSLFHFTPFPSLHSILPNPTHLSSPYFSSISSFLRSRLPIIRALNEWEDDADATTMTVGHIAENCTSQERLCYNCRKPGHESSACTEPRSVAAKQCYSCGGIGHIQAECPTLRLQGSNQKCYVRASVISPPFFCCLPPQEAWERREKAQRMLRWLFVELWSFWTYRARLSQRRSIRLWFCVARSATWSWIERGVAPARQVLSLWWAKPHGTVRVAAAAGADR
jgi:hypothetical protein